MDDNWQRKEWENLIAVRAQQAEILRSLNDITADHEKRIRFLERIIGFGIGGAAILKMLLDYGLSR